ncbi:MAG: thiamine phosphate synthase [Actinomycetota bacterium]
MVGCAIGPDRVLAMKVMVITGPPPSGRTHLEVARGALAAGCPAVQMRDKEMGDREFSEVATRLLAECRSAHAVFLINDRVDVAAAVGADGVHLGVEDLAVEHARSLLGPGAILGFSPESIEQARAAVSDGADYLGVGPVFGTESKEDAGPAIGLERLAEYCSKRIAPVIAVGGIDADNARLAFETGAVGVAVLSAVACAKDIEEAARRLMEAAR